MKKVIVISLGGSLIVPEKTNNSFLIKFIKTLKKSNNKFVIVCGGGAIARRYISILKAEGKPKSELAKAGIRATRMNAQLIMQMFGKDANDKIPLNIKQVRYALSKNKFIVCGALRFTPNSTSDSTAAQLARALKSQFVNMTNVRGLFDKDPKKFKHAKFIPKISWRDFEKMALKIKYKPGQNFVLDQKASTIIRKYKIPTYLVGSIEDLSKVLKQKRFQGTLISG